MAAENNRTHDEVHAALVVGQAPTTQGRSTLRVVLLVASLSMAIFLAALDAVMVATALPSISEDLQLSASSYAWVATAYLLGTVATMVAWARISDIFGRKTCILAANVLFMVGCLVCALAHGAPQMMAGRAVQGLGAGGLLVLPNVCISDIFSLRERGFYLSIMGGVWAFASSIGPIVGGAFAEYVTWRWLFWVNLPCLGLSLLGLLLFLDVHNPRTPLIKGISAIDWLGVLLLAGATIMFLLGINFGGIIYPWSSPTTICLIVFGVLTYLVFGTWQTRSPCPILPLHVFASVSNLAVFTVCFFHGMGYISVIYYLPYYFQSVLDATPLLSGVYTLALAIPLSIAAIATGIIIRRTGTWVKELVLGGMALMTLGVGLLINLQPYASWPRIIIFQIIIAVGMAPVFQAPLVILHRHLKPKDIASATSAFAMTRQVASSIALVAGQAILQSGKLEDNIALTRSMSYMWIFFACSCFAGLLAALWVQGGVLESWHVEHRTGLTSEAESSGAESRGGEEDKKEAV